MLYLYKKDNVLKDINLVTLREHFLFVTKKTP